MRAASYARPLLTRAAKRGTSRSRSLSPHLLPFCARPGRRDSRGETTTDYYYYYYYDYERLI